MSIAAFQESDTLVCVAPPADNPVGVVGACVSAHADVDAVIELFAEWLSAAS